MSSFVDVNKQFDVQVIGSCGSPVHFKPRNLYYYLLLFIYKRAHSPLYTEFDTYIETDK